MPELHVLDVQPLYQHLTHARASDCDRQQLAVGMTKSTQVEFGTAVAVLADPPMQKCMMAIMLV